MTCIQQLISNFKMNSLDIFTTLLTNLTEVKNGARRMHRDQSVQCQCKTQISADELPFFRLDFDWLLTVGAVGPNPIRLGG